MIEIIKGLPKNVVGIAVEGRVTEKDCQLGNHLNATIRSGSTMSSIRDFRVLRGTISMLGSSMFRRASGSQL